MKVICNRSGECNQGECYHFRPHKPLGGCDDRHKQAGCLGLDDDIYSPVLCIDNATYEIEYEIEEIL